MDRDGTGIGFDCELTRAVADAVRIPVIASGGAGGAGHFTEVFRDGHADAALAASIFHYGFSRLADLKQEFALAHEEPFVLRTMVMQRRSAFAAAHGLVDA